ncbi:uncharacterized protein, partial [Diabrotica undecimpunctata]|uniref:uncharacterized protein n=1 Tax=Diabrotica undecimpunctata TaxID=50387 RepID=UPI003B63EF11
MKCGDRDTNYFFTQFLTGHGSFRAYLERIGKVADGNCTDCGVADTAEHCVFECRRFDEDRNELYRKLGRVSTNTIMQVAMRGETEYKAILEAVTQIVRKKEILERNLQQ